MSSPKIVGPLGPCSQTIRLQGQIPGDTVQVLASFTNIWDTVCKQTATAPDEIFSLTRPLKPGENVCTYTLTSTSPNEIVQQEGPIGYLAGVTHPYTCGSCLWLANATPGATVEVRDTAGMLRGTGPAPDGNARLSLSPPIALNETLIATQFVCDKPGPALSLPPADQVSALQSALAPPRIVGVLLHCDTAVRVEGVVEGATVTVAIDGVDLNACFDRSALWFNLGRELKTGQKVNVRQSLERCQLESQPSSPDVVVQELTALDPPFVRGPLCKGTRFITVANLRPGSIVSIIQDELEIGGGAAWDTECDFNIDPLVYRYNSSVTATQTRCNLGSAPAPEVTVNALTGTLPPPVVVGPLFQCGAAVRVENLHPGGRVDAVSQSLGVIGTAYVWSTSVDIIVSPALIFPDDISAVQTACGQVSKSATSQTVLKHPLILAPPSLIEPVWSTRALVPVENVVPGAWVDVSVDNIFSASAPATRTIVDVSLAAPPLPGQVISARQRLCNLVSNPSERAIVQNIDDYDVRPVPGSVSRVCQLTGGYDPEGLVHLNDTTGAAVLGTDLGSSVDHLFDSEHRTYFFFGDTTGHYSGVSDCMFYTTDDTPEPNGPHLTCITVTNPADDDFGAFAPLAVHDVSLPQFNVPTGVFEWDGRVYVFVTTDYQSDADPMRRSVLGSAVNPANEFVNHGNIDVEGAPGVGAPDYDFRFINISPWVIANDDWSGLPDNALPGQYGVLLCGSGKYRASSPYLAYVPIEQVTSPRTGWRYFSRTVTDINGNPWSADLTEASPLFNDPVIGELSLSYHPDLQKWLLLYNNNNPPGGDKIVIRSATVPWRQWSGPDPHNPSDSYPDPCVLFPLADGQGKFIHKSGEDDLDLLPPAKPGKDGGVYGPYLVSRWNRWDRIAQREQVYFVMSTWVPYQPQLMRAQLDLIKR